MVSRVCLYSAWRKPEGDCQTDVKYLGCLAAYRAVAWGACKFRIVGRILWRPACAGKAAMEIIIKKGSGMARTFVHVVFCHARLEHFFMAGYGRLRRLYESNVCVLERRNRRPHHGISVIIIFSPASYRDDWFPVGDKKSGAQVFAGRDIPQGGGGACMGNIIIYTVCGNADKFVIQSVFVFSILEGT